MRRLMTTKEAAQYLGYSEPTLRTSRTRSTLGGVRPPVWLKMGKSVRYEISELDRWIDAAKQK